MSQLKDWLKDFKMNEGLLSMVLGGLVIIIVIGLLVGYVRKINTKSGQITDKSAQTEISATTSEIKNDTIKNYVFPKVINLNQFAYSGEWMVGYEYSAPVANASLILRFEGIILSFKILLV